MTSDYPDIPWVPPAAVTPISERERTLLEAIKAITQERNNEYGPPTQDFRRTAGMWTLLFGHMLKDNSAFGPADVAMAMIALKLSRATWSPDKMDHWIDIAGYAGCGWECVMEGD